MLENASFVHVFGCIGMFELTVSYRYRLVDDELHSSVATPNWFELDSYL